MDLNPLPVLFSEKDFKSNFPLSGNFVPVGQFFSGQPLNFLQIGSRKWSVGVKVEVASPFGEDGCQERCRAAGTTRTPRAPTYYDSTTFGRNPAPLLPF